MSVKELCQMMVDKASVKAWNIISQLPNDNIFSLRSFIGKNGVYENIEAGENKFRVLSYNLLADHLVKPELYHSFELKYVEKETRINNIFE